MPSRSLEADLWHVLNSPMQFCTAEHYSALLLTTMQLLNLKTDVAPFFQLDYFNVVADKYLVVMEMSRYVEECF